MNGTRWITGTTVKGTTLMCCAMAASMPTAPVFAQSAADYPSKPVTFIIPFAPGSSTEVDARVYTQALSDNLSRSFVVDFKPGAGSTIGTNYVAKAAPDGYTVLFFTSSFSTSAALYKNLPYDPIRDLAPVSLLSKRPLVLVVHPDLPIRSTREYVDYARANPGKLNVVTAGSGSASHFAAAWLHQATNLKVTFVHYKGGGPMFLDLLSGRAQASVTTLESAAPHIKSGKLRALGITSMQPAPNMPALPSIADQGVPGYDYSGELGVLAPRATPRPIVLKLSGELARAARSPEVAKKLDGSIMVGSTPEELGERLAANIRRFKELAQEADIKSEE